MDYFKKINIIKLDYVIVIYLYEDYIGSMDDVINYCIIGIFYVLKVIIIIKIYENMIDVLKKKNLKIIVLKVGE